MKNTQSSFALAPFALALVACGASREDPTTDAEANDTNGSGANAEEPSLVASVWTMSATEEHDSEQATDEVDALAPTQRNPRPMDG